MINTEKIIKKFPLANGGASINPIMKLPADYFPSLAECELNNNKKTLSLL